MTSEGKPVNRRSWNPVLLGLLGAVLLSGAPAAWTAERAGEVLLLTGRARAATPDGTIRSLKKGAAVESGDTLVTSPSSYLRVKFTDGGYTVLRPNTRFVIEDYHHEAKAEPKQERSFFRLIKGGFRALTGLVGRRNRDNYKVRTAVATIGIRGTDFQARLCEGDCLEESSPDGLYVGVINTQCETGGGGPHAGDAVSVSNDGGRLDVQACQYAYVSGLDSRPLVVGPEFALPLSAIPIPPADPADCQ